MTRILVSTLPIFGELAHAADAARELHARDLLPAGAPFVARVTNVGAVAVDANGSARLLDVVKGSAIL